LAQRVQPSADLKQSVESSIQWAKAFDADVQNEANAYKRETKATLAVQHRCDREKAETERKENPDATSYQRFPLTDGS